MPRLVFRSPTEKTAHPDSRYNQAYGTVIGKDTCPLRVVEQAFSSGGGVDLVGLDL
jgi:hypothetical protein